MKTEYKVEIIVEEPEKVYLGVGSVDYKLAEALTVALDNGDGLMELDWAFCREVSAEIGYALEDLQDRTSTYVNWIGYSEYHQLLSFFENFKKLADKFPSGLIKVQ